MERGVEDRNVLDSFAEKFCGIVESHARYIVVSGFVAISHGRRRTTEDIDMIIEKMSKEDFLKLHRDLLRNGFHCMQSSSEEEVYEYLKNKVSVRYTNNKEFFPPEMEVKFVKDEIDGLQIRTRKKLKFTGLDIWFSSIEMNIAFKEEYLGSDKDFEDAKHLRIIYKDELDVGEIAKIKKMIKERKKNEGQNAR